MFGSPMPWDKPPGSKKRAKSKRRLTDDANNAIEDANRAMDKACDAIKDIVFSDHFSLTKEEGEEISETIAHMLYVVGYLRSGGMNFNYSHEDRKVLVRACRNK